MSMGVYEGRGQKTVPEIRESGPRPNRKGVCPVGLKVERPHRLNPPRLYQNAGRFHDERVGVGENDASRNKEGPVRRGREHHGEANAENPRGSLLIPVCSQQGKRRRGTIGRAYLTAITLALFLPAPADARPALAYRYEKSAIEATYQFSVKAAAERLDFEVQDNGRPPLAEMPAVMKAVHGALLGPLAVLADDAPLPPKIERLDIRDSDEGPYVDLLVRYAIPPGANALLFRWTWTRLGEAPVKATLEGPEGTVPLEFSKASPEARWVLPPSSDAGLGWGLLIGLAAAALAAGLFAWRWRGSS